MQCKGLDRLMDSLDKFINNLPRPLLEPIWFPGVPGEEIKGEEFIAKLAGFLKDLAEMIVEAMKEEGFFDHNPVIRVYPKYNDASGIVIYYKGRKVFERWFSPMDLDWNNRQKVRQDIGGWYEEMYRDMRREDPDELAYLMGDPPWEVR